MKKLLLHSLLKHYSYLVIVIILFFASVLSYLNWEQYIHTVESTQQGLVDSLAEEVELYSSRLRHRLYDFSSDTDKRLGMYRYFQLSPAEYQMWLLKNPLLFIKEVSLQKNIASIYRDLPFVTGIDIALASEGEVYHSTAAFKSGFRMLAADYKAPPHSFAVNFYEASSSSVAGTVYVSVDESIFDQVVQRRSTLPFSISIKDSVDRVLYEQGPESNHSFQTFSRTAGGLEIQVAISYDYIFREVGLVTALIYFASGLLITLLLVVLNRVFRIYQVQVTDVVDTVQLITQGKNYIRIAIENKEQEMYVLSTQINQMLDSLDKNIRDIYRLELAQKEANMRALQSQINPHFLYNTLEYFRMYAVREGMNELAEVIYQFSSLLRSRISQSNQTTIREELEMCEKYSYICQIRYPKSIAYSYQIEKCCEKIEIPRFVIQPLVENYFLHGVDLKRKNNAISVKVFRKENGVEILIRDNGKGMSKEVLYQYKKVLSKTHLEQIEVDKRTSIGILNVHERMILYFGKKYHITLSSKEGVTYSIYLADIF